MDSKEILRRKLREKIRSKRNQSEPDLIQQVRNDPASALLNMGVTDPNILNMSLNSQNALSLLGKLTQSMTTPETFPSIKDKEGLSAPKEESDEKGLPPSKEESDEEGLPPSKEESDEDPSNEESVEEGLPPSNEESVEEGLPPSNEESDEEGLPPSNEESDEEGLPPSK